MKGGAGEKSSRGGISLYVLKLPEILIMGVLREQ